MAERAWAHAMHMKSSHADDNAGKGIPGSTRKHVVSRLHRAHSYAMELVESLQDKAVSGATDMDVLEAQAYASCLVGAQEFEKHATQRYEDAEVAKTAWRKCLTSFSEAHIIYTALVKATQKDVFKEVLAGTVDPSIRYAAYQSRLSRTVAISAVAKDYFPQDNVGLVSDIEKIHPSALSEEQATQASTSDGTLTADIPTSVTWRSRNAPIADSAVGQALAATSLASTQLAALFTSSSSSKAPKTLAASYDPVLTAAQDVVDATHRALADLAREGISESDSRMQDLRVTDLYANYTLISWRVGRNRVLISSATNSSSSGDDGLQFQPAAPSTPKRPPKDGTPHLVKPEARGRKLARLRERLVLYDATLQSLDSIGELSGASRDEGFINELSNQRAYFQALRALNIGYSHAVVSRPANALALFARAAELLNNASPQGVKISSGAVPTLAISADAYDTARTHVQALVTQYRGLVALHSSFNSSAGGQTATYNSASDPLVAKLDSYPPPGAAVDLQHLVTYPPKLVPVPVKPIFLDLAWNYIDYPGRERGTTSPNIVETVIEKVQDVVMEGVEEGKKEVKKRGWFGFGRS